MGDNTPFMPLWVSDFLGDTQGLDATETGAYMLLIMAQWRAGGASLPNDPKRLQMMAKCGRAWPRVWEKISPYFQTDEAGVYNRKGREVFESVALKREASAQNGARGGAAKALNKNRTKVADASHQPEQNLTIPKAELKEEGDRLDKSNPPPSLAAVEIVSDKMIAALAKAVGYDEPPKGWGSATSKAVIAGWLAGGLRQIEVLKRAKASRSVHPEPPATVQALASFMGPSTRRSIEPPAAEADIIAHWVKTLNGTGYVPQSAISPSLARRILATGQVEPERLKSRGITF